MAEMRRQIEMLYRLANHGDDNRTAEQAGGDWNRKAIRQVIDDIAKDVKALKDAHPHAWLGKRPPLEQGTLPSSWSRPARCPCPSGCWSCAAA
jgi:hypothetical protein